MMRQPEDCYITLEVLQQLVNSNQNITVIVNGEYYNIKEVKQNVALNNSITTD